MSKKSRKKSGTKTKDAKAARPKTRKKPVAEAKPKRISALDAAATVL